MGTIVYDNWERLVAATLNREKLRLLANSPSISSTTTTTTTGTAVFSSTSNGYNFGKSIQLAYSLIRFADDSTLFRTQCLRLKSNAQNLLALLHRAARASYEDYDRPMRRIVDDMVEVLDKALALVLKCRGNSLMTRVFIIIPAAAFSRTLSQLKNCIANVSWLLSISASADDRADEYLGLPPISAEEPILCFIWEHISILCTGSVDDRAYAAESLGSLAGENDRYGKLIIDEGGVGPLLKLAKEGKLEGQEKAARAIGLLGKDPESVEHMIHAGVCSVFAKILNVGPMKVQAVVAWAVSELAAHYPKCQDLFPRHNIIRFLVSHLAFETVEEHSRYGIIVNNRVREMEDPATKEYIKAMSARALWQLAKRNRYNCQSITEMRALLCFAVLLEKGGAEVQYNSAMALMEITAVAELDAELRRSAFKPNSPACKAMVDQLYRVVEMGESELLIPCIKAIGNLARTFKATETRMIRPLVKLVDENTNEGEVCREACIALTKFASWENFLHLDHCKAIVGAGGVKHLVQIVYFGPEFAQNNALILLCYIAMSVPESIELAHAEVLTLFDWALRQAFFIQNEYVGELLPEAKGKLELYQHGDITSSMDVLIRTSLCSGISFVISLSAESPNVESIGMGDAPLV